jgi:LysR family transcriptional regulator for metE and metH
MMIVQLVASRHGVAALPSWALGDALQRGTVTTLRLGEEGLWSNLYAALRTVDLNKTYVAEFVALARATCFQHLAGIAAI